MSIGLHQVAEFDIPFGAPDDFVSLHFFAVGVIIGRQRINFFGIEFRTQYSLRGMALLKAAMVAVSEETIDAPNIEIK